MRSREAVGKAGWNPALAGKPQTIDDLKFANYFKEIFLDSDTKVALHLRRRLRGAARLVPHQRDEGRGARQGEPAHRLAAHDVARHLHAGHAGLDGAGRPGHRPAQARLVQGLHHRRQHQQAARASTPGAWTTRSSLYPFYEKLAKAGLVNVCVHKGLYPPSTTKQFPHLARLRRRARRGQGGQGLAAAQLRHLPLRRSASPAASGTNGLGAVRADRPRRLGDRPRRDSRRSTASPTSTATSARSSPRARWPSRASARP